MSGRSVELRRTIAASPARVFQAWTDPAWLARWMSPVGHALVEADVRVGGRLRVVMVGGDREIEHYGTYLEVEAPHRLSFTWRSPHTGDQQSRVVVELVNRNGATDLLLRHELLPDDAVESHAGGWGAMVDRLTGELVPMAAEAPHGA